MPNPWAAEVGMRSKFLGNIKGLNSRAGGMTVA